ncbi:hypothetical protein [Lysobacter brunescens]|uniref:Uncharacterized protein n=1 Tax=Lysobacter brunescens TaxID=262323 RepID=A0ABW2YCF0_9GAMM
MHVFVIERRWQKAWLYLLLATIHTTSAAFRAARRLLRIVPARRRAAD